MTLASTPTSLPPGSGQAPSSKGAAPSPGSPVVLCLQQLELIFDAVAGVRGGELELLGEVGGALRDAGWECGRVSAPPTPHFLGCALQVPAVLSE